MSYHSDECNQPINHLKKVNMIVEHEYQTNETSPSNSKHKPKIVIGLGFEDEVGKDTVAEYICNNYGFINVANATALKQGVSVMFGLTKEQLYDPVEKAKIDTRWSMTPRQILRMMGTEVMKKNFGEDFWIKAVQRQLDVILPMKDNVGVIITDCRSKRECGFVHDISSGNFVSEVFRVDRDEEKRTSYIPGCDEAAPKHITQTELGNYTGWDGIIENNSTKEDLYQKLDKLMQNHFGLQKFAVPQNNYKVYGF